MSTLQDQLLQAHDRDDRGALVALYTQAADQADGIDAACFFLTHAYIFALELSDPTTDALYARLHAQGRV